MLRSFGHVQLLVSDCDVKSYKQIKDDLDDLRLLVEKSELWVYKTVKLEDKKVSRIIVAAAPAVSCNGCYSFVP